MTSNANDLSFASLEIKKVDPQASNSHQQLDAKIPSGLYNREANHVRKDVMETLRVLGLSQSWTFRFAKEQELAYAKGLVEEFERRNTTITFITDEHSAKGGFHSSGNKNFTLKVTKCLKGASGSPKEVAENGASSSDPFVFNVDGKGHDHRRHPKGGRNTRDKEEGSSHPTSKPSSVRLDKEYFKVNLGDRITTGERHNEITDFIVDHLNDCLSYALSKTNLTQLGEKIFSAKVKISSSGKFVDITLDGIDEPSRKALKHKLVGHAEDGYNLNKLEIAFLEKFSFIYHEKKANWESPHIDLDIDGFRDEREYKLFAQIKDAIESGEESVTVVLFRIRERTNLSQILRHISNPRSPLRFEPKGRGYPCDAYISLHSYDKTGEIPTPNWLKATEHRLLEGKIVNASKEETEEVESNVKWRKGD